jgi:hypothetical protein
LHFYHYFPIITISRFLFKRKSNIVAHKIKLTLLIIPDLLLHAFFMPNQNPEQIARDHIDKQLTACGWIIQGINQVNLHVGIGVAVKEYRWDVRPADYILFVNGKP